jgi:exodeoxyribonuclease III
MFKVASWNLNSVRSRLTHVTAWLKVREPDVLLLQELKGTEFPSEAFKSLGYESVAVTQKAYNGVATISRHPMKTIARALVGDDSDSHARFLEVIIRDIRIVNIYVPNGNPVGSDKFAYKLAWMDRLTQQMIRWKQNDVPTLIGGDFNVIPEDIDCHKPSSWEHDALFQPEPRARYRAMLGIAEEPFPPFFNHLSSPWNMAPNPGKTNLHLTATFLQEAQMSSDKRIREHVDSLRIRANKKKVISPGILESLGRNRQCCVSVPVGGMALRKNPSASTPK